MVKDVKGFKAAFIEKVQAQTGAGLEEGTYRDYYTALAALLRDEIAQNWAISNTCYKEKKIKQVYYFSIEFLPGKLLRTNLINLGMETICCQVLSELGIDFEMIEKQEPDAGLGSGGLGRLASCFLDSLASRGFAGHGCGIRYKHGLFEQRIVNGYQVELPDPWLRYGNMWEVCKRDKAVTVRFGGRVRPQEGSNGLAFVHEGYEEVLAIPYDIPIVGYDNKVVNTLRLWSAEPVNPVFDLSSFNRGEYLKMLEYNYSVEAISEILYPDDSYYHGKVLRLKQQYFFVSAGLQSIVRRYKKKGLPLKHLDEAVAIHINDTHPALAIAELMRILMDEEKMGWDEAWQVTYQTISYTNHTIMPEAMEKWPTDVFSELLPRIYLIIEEINRRFIEELKTRYPHDIRKYHDMAIIADGYVKMAHLAVVGSQRVNGVAKLHTDILEKRVMRDFYEYCPYKFGNKTNGITHRRWLLKANPGLAALISDVIGTSWITHAIDLLGLLHYDEDSSFHTLVHAVKQKNKQRLANYIHDRYNLNIDTNSIFDVHVKRVHAYKRQILNVFHILNLYDQLRNNPGLDIPPRTFIFAGKAAPGYHYAKSVIKLIHSLAALVNEDKAISDKLKVVFLENYSVSLAELIIPAADVSEQISTASKEASGTSNMKFMMNGAVTIGTLDGANIEIRDEVGEENFVSFGLSSDEVLQYYQFGGYDAWAEYNGDTRIKTVVDGLVNDSIPLAGSDEFRILYDSLLKYNDEFFVLKDFPSYIDAQQRITGLYQKREIWLKMCIHNLAHSGKFSSDRTIAEYAIGVWKIRPINFK